MLPGFFALLFFCIIGSYSVISCRYAGFNHLCYHMVELCSILTCDDWSAEALLQVFSGIASDRSTSLGDALVRFKSGWLFLLGQFPRCNFGKLIERQLRGAHIIAETLFFESL